MKIPALKLSIPLPALLRKRSRALASAVPLKTVPAKSARVWPSILRKNPKRAEPSAGTTFTAATPSSPLSNLSSLPLSSRMARTKSGASRVAGFLGDVDEIGSARPAAGSVINGQLVFINTGEEKPEGSYTRQAPRRLTRWYNIRAQQYLQVWVHDALIASAPGVRFRFAVDAILRYGQNTRGRCIIFNGYAASGHTYLNSYSFKDGQLLSVAEHLVPANPSRYETEMRLIVGDLNNFADTKLYWTSPLPEISYPGLTILPAEIFTKVRSVALGHSGRRSLNIRALAPVIACGIALSAYALTIGSQLLSFRHYAAQADQEHRAIATLSEPLDVLAARDAWLRAPNLMAAHTSAIAPLLSTIAMHGAWRVKSLTISAQAKDTSAGTGTRKPAAAGNPSAQAEPDLELVLSVPSTGAAPLDQAQPILEHLAGATGTDLHLADNGQTSKADDGERLELHIQGSLSNTEPGAAGAHAGAITGVRP
ncbi:hypothetical protein [Burkholderia sp. LMG 13014]|uniref:hypothetical protein n=1 Tax=Burkholderia sp. LMG 13014 TaxID=2709306 RepID=UPI001966218E|nr:hypothetical protein [Burkholderia sp. LMG 13014]